MAATQPAPLERIEPILEPNGNGAPGATPLTPVGGTNGDRRAEIAEDDRPVVRIGRALAVVPSVRPTHKAWRRLGFTLSDPFEFMGCAAFDLVLRGAGVRFLAPPARRDANLLTAAVDSLLETGSGLLGWTWACQSVFRSRELIEKRGDVEFGGTIDGRKSTVVPGELSPAATTLLEPLVHEEVPPHGNRITGLDHLVLMVGDVDAAAERYEQAFGLSARRRTVGDRRYAFVKVGRVAASVIEIVGPSEKPAEPIAGCGWGLAFQSDDLDATIAYLRSKRITLSDAQPALQGGRIVSLPMQIGGISIAFLGK